MSEVILLLSAEIDIQQAYNRYEEYQEGRGVIFIHHLEAAFNQLRTFPKCGPVVFGIYRRLLVPSFPYGIFYAFEARGIVIIGVMDNRQDPEAIARRLH